MAHRKHNRQYHLFKWALCVCVCVGWIRTETILYLVAALQIREPHLKTHLPSLSVVAPVCPYYDGTKKKA